MFGLTPLGIVHTAIGLVAVACGFWALARYKEITAQTAIGRTYLVTTFLTAATGLGIFQHGGFGPPHALSILTLIALATGFAAAQTGVLGRRTRYLQAACYSGTLLFHMIPAFTETLTRLPAGGPVFPDADAPGLRPIYAALLVVFAVGLALQLRWLRAEMGKPALAGGAG